MDFLGSLFGFVYQCGDAFAFLVLAACGLAVIFGMMGVINLAHGEFIMIGAYSTYLVERFMQAHLPGLFDAYIFVAIPVASYVIRPTR